MSRQRKWLTILLVVIVYVPLIHNALLGQPAFIPWRMNEFWRFTDLFPYATAVWPVNQVFVQGADDEWRQVPQTPLFQHNLFGRMTRLDMLHLMLSPGRADDATTLEVKRGIFARVCHAFAAAHDAEDGEAAAVLRAEGYPPIPRPVRAVRLVTVWLPVVDEPIAPVVVLASCRLLRHEPGHPIRVPDTPCTAGAVRALACRA